MHYCMYRVVFNEVLQTSSLFMRDVTVVSTSTHSTLMGFNIVLIK